MEFTQFFLGRFHPLLVHLPIGILFLAFIFDVFSQSRRYKKLSVVVQPALFWGAIGAVGSVITGYFLSLEGGYEARTLQLHQYAGIATAVFACALYVLRKNKKLLNMERRKRFPVRLFLFIPLMLALTVTGHMGGSLTHGEEFLSEALSMPVQNVDPFVKLQSISNTAEAVAYGDIIQPIIESKCYSCHSSKKQKGELRLDAIDLILKGGKHGSVLTNGLADSSSLYSRLVLPLEDEKHMPPKEKPQLSSAEIDLIRLWINDGASFEKKIKELNQASKADQYIKLILESGKQRSWIPDEETSAPNEQAVNDLRNHGALVLPLAADNNYISVSFINSRTAEKQKLERLLPVKDQLVSLKLSYSSVSRSDLDHLKQFKNLVWLYLDHTQATDSCIDAISSLSKLKYLNLVNTRVTDAAVPLLSKLTSLEEVYLYQSQISATGIATLVKKLPSLKIDSGSYVLPSLAGDTIIHRRKI